MLNKLMNVYGGILVLLALLGVPLVAAGDIKVKLKLEYSSYLQFEPVNAYVTIENDSDYELVIGNTEKEGNSRIEFIVEKDKDEVVQRSEKRAIVTNFRAKPGEKWETMRDVSTWYDMTTMGRYTIRAVVNMNGQAWESNPLIVDVVRGIEVASKTRSVPGYEDVVRTYSLRYWSRGRVEYLFLCVDEEKTKTNYGVIELGPVIRVSKPVVEVNKDGNVVVVHQSSSDCYTRSVFKSTKSGVDFIDQTYHLADGKPYPNRSKGKTSVESTGKKKEGN
jgi:hypothetical protein